MHSGSAFLGLPREIRDSIYYHYVYDAGGYHYNYDTNKLRASGERLIDLSLMYTCRLVANEMHHVALTSNVLHFKTVYSESERRKAALFDVYFWQLETYYTSTLRFLAEPDFRHYETREVTTEIETKFPQFKWLLPHLREKKNDVSYWDRMSDAGRMIPGWGEAGSVARDFESCLIRLLSTGTAFLQAVAKRYDELAEGIIQDSRGMGPLRPRYAEFFGHDVQQYSREMILFLRSGLPLTWPEPWTIPSENELLRLNTAYEFPWGERFWERIEWRYSAVTAAIRFLRSWPCTVSGTRHIVLHEDRPSVAHPECHAIGLIPFCLEYPQIRIERRVNIWRNLLIASVRGENASHHAEYLQKICIGRANRETPPGLQAYDSYGALQISNMCAQWIAEALALSAKGMPVGSFTLVLDGDPAPDQAAALFDIVQEDAATQVAQMQWYAEKSLSPSIMEMRVGGLYFAESFPQAINNIVKRESVVRCNFPTDNEINPKSVLDRYRHLDYRYMDGQWSPSTPGATPSTWIYFGLGRHFRRAWITERRQNRFWPSSPLPDLLADLALEDVIPIESQKTP